MGKLTSNEYWDDINNKINFKKHSKNNPISILINQYIKKGNGTCIEIGCFPGGYLSIFGDLGYTLNGIDINPRVDRELPQWLLENNYKVGDFYKTDFLTLDNKKRYDIVCSFGFIEHFSDWQKIFIKHLNLVNDDGYIIVTTPNFKGVIQNYFHKNLDICNYNRHFIESMDPYEWSKIAIQNKFNINFAGYFGGFKLWSEDNNNNVIKNALSKSIPIIVNSFGSVIPDNKCYSSYCGLIAKKI